MMANTNFVEIDILTHEGPQLAQISPGGCLLPTSGRNRGTTCAFQGRCANWKLSSPIPYGFRLFLALQSYLKWHLEYTL